MSYGKSLSLSQNTFIAPPKVEVELSEGESSSRRPRRRANLYDAVAGRVNVRGFHPAVPLASRYRDTASSGARALRPEELLFRPQNSSTRSTDNEIYFAHETLPADRPLPSSELLEAIHAYAADLYEFTTDNNGYDDHQSMDETALLAMGILVEEMAKDALGETGDLVLVEGQALSDDDQDASAESDTVPQIRGRVPRRKRSNTGANSGTVSSQDNLKGVRRKWKRRKLTRGASVTDTEIDEGR